ncbi:sensor histidine kinase [Cellulophaga baltica]|uniref:histidine kinase n=1 Tax=Cellulophaga baltica 18 TaxID=1348584 RepID=A0AAU8S741_9FLAO|nr:HAMP domain-containing sensor histidine kinase [Cellulophaga baltica]AIZ43594.1 hypothetical protein M666_19805 [Cellulophaga baltica 18]
MNLEHRLTLILNPVDKILSSFNTDPDVIKESAISIQRSARRLLHLVNQLLDYRKMDVGMAPLQLENGDAVKFCGDIFALFKGLAAKKSIEYQFITESKHITSLFDFDKLEKIITNLISNAIKFTDYGGEISVFINEVKVDKANTNLLLFKKNEGENYLEIIVKDTGVGLNKEQLKKYLFTFYNVDVTKTGTGIGLNFTKALVELHGGEIFVESEYLKEVSSWCVCLWI